MVWRHDHDRLNAVRTRCFGSRHLAPVGIPPIGSDTDFGRGSRRVRRIGREGAGHQRDAVVEPHRQPMDRTYERIAAASDHADAQPRASSIHPSLRRPCVSSTYTSAEVRTVAINGYPPKIEHNSILSILKMLPHIASSGRSRIPGLHRRSCMVKPKRADVAAKPPGQRAKTHAGGRDALGYTRPQTYEELRAVLSSGTTISQTPARGGDFPLAAPRRRCARHHRSGRREGWRAAFDSGPLLPDLWLQPASPISRASSRSMSRVPGRKDEPSARPVDADISEADLYFLNGMVSASQNSLGRVGERVRYRELQQDGRTCWPSRSHPRHRQQARFSGHHIHIADAVAAGRPQCPGRQCRLDGLDQVGCIGEPDAVLAVSFSPYNSITPDLVAVAREREMPRWYRSPTARSAR